MSAPSKTAALYEAHCAIRTQHWDELQAMAKTEFPAGAEVEWEDTFGARKLPIRRRGTVVRIGWCAEVRLAIGGSLERVELHKLSLAKPKTH